MRTASSDREQSGLRVNVELYLVLVLLGGLFICFAILTKIEDPTPRHSPLAIWSREAPLDRFAFIRSANRPILINQPSLPPILGPHAISAWQFANALPQVSGQTHALLADTAVDPLGAMLIHGLPSTATLSAGVKTGKDQWAVAIGDLDNVVVLIPRNQDVIRTRLDLKSRAGTDVHSFTVVLQHTPANTSLRTSRLPPVAAAQKKPKIQPAKGSRTLKKAPAKYKVSSAKAVVPPLAKPAIAAPSAKPAIVAPSAAAPKPPQTSAAQVPGSISLPPMPEKFFNPDPKDTLASGLSSVSREDPRFMILRGLGMPPSSVESGP
jgi:hypothetical protein